MLLRLNGGAVECPASRLSAFLPVGLKSPTAKFKAKQCVEILLEVYSRGRTRDVLKTSCPARGTGVRIAPLPPALF